MADSYSSDGTRQLAERKVDRIIDVAEGNLYRAVNAGVEATRTQWVTYLNGDDLLYADAVGDMLAQARPADDVLYGNIDFVDGVGRFLHAWRSPQAREYLPLAASRVMPVPQQGTLFRREVFDRLGGFDLTFNYSADFDFFLRAYLAGFHFAKFGLSSVSAFRVHRAQISQKHGQEMWDEGMLSLARSRLVVAGWRRRVALVKLRLRNWDAYVMRVLRWRQMKGVWKLSGTLALD